MTRTGVTLTYLGLDEASAPWAFGRYCLECGHYYGHAKSCSGYSQKRVKDMNITAPDPTLPGSGVWADALMRHETFCTITNLGDRFMATTLIEGVDTTAEAADPVSAIIASMRAADPAYDKAMKEAT